MIDLPQTKSITLNSYIEEIKKSIKDKNFLSVLCMTLIIPDICINYLGQDNKEGKAYKKWFDKYVGNNIFPDSERKKKREIDNIKFDGKTCYSLRCSILHEGTIPVEYKYLKDEKINKYKSVQLCVNSKSDSECQYGEAKSVRTSLNAKEYSLRINIVNFAKEMIAGYEMFLKDIGKEDIRLFTMIDWDNRSGEIIFTPNEQKS